MFTYGQDFYATQIGGVVRPASVMALIVPGIRPARSAGGGGCGVGIRPAVIAGYRISGLPGLEGDAVDRTAPEIPATPLQVA